MRTFKAATLALALWAACTPAAWAATPEEVDAAKRDKELAEYKRDRDKADAEAAKARLGSIDSSRLSKAEGEATNTRLEGKILAYDAIGRIAGRIADDVAPALQGRTVVIHSDKELNAILQQRAFATNLKNLNQQMTSYLLPPLPSDRPDCADVDTAGGGGLGPLGSIDVALQVLQLFRSDKKLEGAEFTADEFAVAMAVLPQLRARGVAKVVYPSTYLAGAFAGDGGDLFARSDTVKQLNTLGDNMVRMDGWLAKVAEKKALIAKRSEDRSTLPKACATVFPQDLAILDFHDARIKGMKARGDRFIAAATTVDEKSGASLLQLLASSEKMAADHRGAYVLQLKSIAAGGNTYTKSNAFSTNFRFSGGAIVSYLLVDGDTGTVAASGTFPEYGGYVKSDDMQGFLRAPR